MRRNTYFVIIILISNVSCSRSPDETGFEIFPDMVHSVAVEAYSEDALKAGTTSMRNPVEGTVARGHSLFEYGKGESEAERAGRELTNPYPVTAQTLALGQRAYENFCLVCHGAQGLGDGPLIPKFPNPPSLTSKTLKTYADGRFYHVIMRGSGDMAEHASQIAPEERWYIVHYIKKLQGRIELKK